ncbi:hypothetical protein Bolokhovo_2 [Bacillus phage Bolokhovo]|uniref:Uncharacterized protein n=1 Tax=Bacillus phage Bolokhovo TaxID=2743970 RepID=A0A7D7PAG3_9CAUD|nr:hypothetical protein Bolokhovo_2 [Bacillus phage Bolokhovo]
MVYRIVYTLIGFSLRVHPVSNTLPLIFFKLVLLYRKFSGRFPLKYNTRGQLSQQNKRAASGEASSICPLYMVKLNFVNHNVKNHIIVNKHQIRTINHNRNGIIKVILMS